MNTDIHNFGLDPLFDEFAERCGQFGLPFLVCDERGRLLRSAHSWDEELVRHILSQTPFKKAVVEAAVRSDGQTDVIDLAPGVRGVRVACTPRKSCRFHILALAVEETADHNTISEGWRDADENIRDLARRCLLSSTVFRASQMQLERFEYIFRWWYTDLRQHHEHRDELGNLSLELGDSYEVISLLLRIGQNMNVAQEPIEFVQSVCRELREVIAFRWVGARLLPGVLEGKVLAGGLISEGDSSLDRRTQLQQTTELLITREFEGAKVLDTSEEKDLREFARLGKKILMHPLMRSGRIVGGVFACDKIDDHDQIDWGDIKMVEAAASHLQIFLDNAALYEDIRLMFIGTLDALTASIDAKDPYTCGHSRRVAHMSRKLADAMGLDPKVVDRIHIAGLVHDVGKIGVPEAILRKPGRLSDDEFEFIKRHPDIGARILRDIPHFEDVLPGVLYHHERYDGRGYPRGLDGENIPLFGRIIAIADSFDAMSSTRQYRQAMPRSRVVEEIRNGAGSQFDPNLVPIFLQLDYSDYDRMAEEQQSAVDPTSREAA